MQEGPGIQTVLRKDFQNNGVPEIAKNVQPRRRDLSFPTQFTTLIYVSQSVCAPGSLMDYFLIFAFYCFKQRKVQQARKSSEDAQASGYARFEKVWAG